MPAAAMRISTSPALGSGTGRVVGTSTSGPPGLLISMTVCVAGMLASTFGASHAWVAHVYGKSPRLAPGRRRWYAAAWQVGAVCGWDCARGGSVAREHRVPSRGMADAVPRLSRDVRLHRVHSSENTRRLVEPFVSGAVICLGRVDIWNVLFRLGLVRCAGRVRVPRGPVRACRDHRQPAADPR